MRAQTTSLILALLVASGAAGCASSIPDDRGDDHEAPARLELAAAVPVDSQSAGIRLAIYRCDKNTPIATRRVGFSAGSLTEFDGFSKTSVRLTKEHLYAREVFSLPVGCYRAHAQVLDIDRRALASCSVAGTPELPLGPRVARSLLLVARCGDAPSDTPLIGGGLNFAPLLTEMTSRFDHASGTFEVCAQTFDAEADRTQIAWSARTESGRTVDVDARAVGVQSGTRRSECAEIAPSDEAIEVVAVARDGHHHSARGFLSHEAYRLYRYGVAASSRAERSVRLAPEAPSGCADQPNAGVENWTYWIRRDGEVLSPTKTLSTVREGDSVQVEIEVSEGCEDVRAEFISFRGSPAAEGATARVFERDVGNLGAGTHILWVEVPERPYVVDLAVEANGERHMLDHRRVPGAKSAPTSLVGIAH